MQSSSQLHHDISESIKSSTWQQFRKAYASKFKKQCDPNTFIVLASIAIIHTTTRNYQIPSLGFGTKSLPRSLLSPSNCSDLISDMHAEMLAVRGFVRFLLEQIKSNKNVYLQWNQKKSKYQLKAQYEVYLYCSEVFCGDCCINQQEESFSGAKPLAFLDAQEYPNQKYKEDVLRTKPGRIDLPVGKRSAILSCSDLIGLCNILGIQGKLLFSVVSPIYLSAIILEGDEKLRQSLSKGTNFKARLHNLLERSEDLIHRQIFHIIVNGKQRQISSQFHHHIPELVIIPKDSSRNREGFDLCGIFTPSHEEWLNGKTGLPEGSSLKNYTQKGKVSRFSQSSLKKEFDIYSANDFTFKYDAILQRIKKLFGQWIDEAGNE